MAGEREKPMAESAMGWIQTIMNMSGCPGLPDHNRWFHCESVHQAPVLFRCHPEDFLLRHWPLKFSATFIDAMVQEGEAVSFKYKGLYTCALPATEQKYCVFIKYIHLQLVVDNCRKAVDSLPHVRVIRQDPYVSIFAEIKSSEHWRSPPLPAPGSPWRNRSRRRF